MATDSGGNVLTMDEREIREMIRQELMPYLRRDDPVHQSILSRLEETRRQAENAKEVASETKEAAYRIERYAVGGIDKDGHYTTGIAQSQEEIKQNLRRANAIGMWVLGIIGTVGSSLIVLAIQNHQVINNTASAVGAH